jgi:hypothetical protein
MAVRNAAKTAIENLAKKEDPRFRKASGGRF